MTLKSPRSIIMRSKPVETERGTDQRGTILFMQVLLDESCAARRRSSTVPPARRESGSSRACRSAHGGDHAVPSSSVTSLAPYRSVGKPLETDSQLVHHFSGCYLTCLLYTSDAADEEDSVDLGGRRII